MCGLQLIALGRRRQQKEQSEAATCWLWQRVRRVVLGRTCRVKSNVCTIFTGANQAKPFEASESDTQLDDVAYSLAWLGSYGSNARRHVLRSFLYSRRSAPPCSIVSRRSLVHARTRWCSALARENKGLSSRRSSS